MGAARRNEQRVLQDLQQYRIVGDQRFFLGACPALELSLAFQGNVACRVRFRVHQSDRPPSRGESTCTPIIVFDEWAIEISGLANVTRTVCATKDVNEPHADDDGIVGSVIQGLKVEMRTVRDRRQERLASDRGKFEPFDSVASLPRAGHSPRPLMTGLAMSEAAKRPSRMVEAAGVEPFTYGFLNN